MNRDELKKSGLLDQYVLGLLGPEQSAEIEALISGDPLLEGEVNRLRKELTDYADASNIAPPPDDGRQPRSLADFQDLDHEMITAMMERNHTLNIWRYVLIAACLLLIGLSGFLFRLRENARAALVSEEAVHAQDAAAYRQDLSRNREAIAAAAANWKDMRTFSETMDSGSLHVHLLTGAGIALVDFSDVPRPPDGEAYYLLGGIAEGGEESAAVEVTTRQMDDLFPVQIDERHGRLSVHRWPLGEVLDRDSLDTPIVAMELPAE